MDDAIRIEKFQAMKRYRIKRTKQFLPGLIQCLATASFLGLFLSSSLWLPHVCSCLRFFFLVSLPSVVTLVSGPKCLFLLCNVIVVFLVGESKLSRAASQTTDIYEEYVNRKSNVEVIQQAESKSRKGSITLMGKAALVEEEEEDIEGDEERGSSEIDKKAEDFIARVNWQRRLEARRLLSVSYRQGG